MTTKTKSINIIDEARELKHPTPFFYTNKEILKQNYEAFTHQFGDHADIYYAVKANADRRILKYLADLGCGFEAASWFEIELLLDIGVKPGRIIYGTAVKPLDHIVKAAAAGVERFAADSKEEVEKIAVSAPGAKVFIRAVVDDSGSVFTFSERFGAPVSTIKKLVLYIRELGLRPYGISFHVGSQAASAARWTAAIAGLRPVIEELYHEGVVLEVLNIGGGFPVSYENHKEVPTLSEIVTQTHNALHALPYMPKIIMEPGRGIVATSTVMVATVISKTVRGGSVWLCLDGGIYNALYEAMIHQGETKYKAHAASLIEGHTTMMTCTLAGPTGDSLDVIARGVSLPNHITVGDRIIFENAGAYTVTMACNFNGFPKPELYIA